MRGRVVAAVLTAIAAALLGAPAEKPAAAWLPAVRDCTASWRRVAFPRLADGPNGSIDALAAVSSTDVWAVGYVGPNGRRQNHPLTAHWDGTSWRRVSAPFGNIEVRDVAAIAHDDVWAVGYGASSSVILHWQGTSWRKVNAPGLGDASLWGVDGSAADDVWAVGTEGLSGTVFLHWDGKVWRRAPGPSLPNVESDGITTFSQLSGVAVLSKRNAWAVGNQPGEGAFDNVPVIAHWDGKEWKLVDAPVLDGGLARLSVVTPTDIWAAGYGAVVHWDGVRWQARQPTFFLLQLGDVAAAGPHDAWLAGPLARWDGSRWRQVPHQPETWVLWTVEAVSTIDVWAAGLQGVPASTNPPLVVHYSCSQR